MQMFDFVKVPYTTAPGMIKNTGAVFNSSPDSEIIKQKRRELEKYNVDLYGQIDNFKDIIELASQQCNVYSNNIIDLALRLEEDVAIMHKGVLIAICFCFPSGFKPGNRVGMTLSQIHMPVADGELLVKASPGISRVMTEQPSFRRWVWTVTNNPNLSNHPNEKISQEPISLDDLYFRYETQTTARVDQDTSLFFVKVNVVPLKEVWNNKILDSINSMSDAVLEYKNLHHIKKLLNNIA